mgnify:FL=1
MSANYTRFKQDIKQHISNTSWASAEQLLQSNRREPDTRWLIALDIYLDTFTILQSRNDAIEALITLPLAVQARFSRIAEEFGVEQDDLRGVGSLAVCEAVESWDSSKGQSLKNWCWDRVGWALIRWLKEECSWLDTGEFVEDWKLEEMIEQTTDHVEDPSYDIARQDEISDWVRSHCSSREAEVYASMYLEDNSQTLTAEELGVSVQRVHELHNSLLAKLRESTALWDNT